MFDAPRKKLVNVSVTAQDDEEQVHPKSAFGAQPLESMSVQELLKLRGRIDGYLPLRSLKDMDMEHELILQFMATQSLQQTTLGEADTPANQKAQCVQALAGCLATLAKLQIEVYTSERLKRIEQALIDEVRKLLPDAQESFLLAYEKAVREALGDRA